MSRILRLSSCDLKGMCCLFAHNAKSHKLPLRAQHIITSTTRSSPHDHHHTQRHHHTANRRASCGISERAERNETSGSARPIRPKVITQALTHDRLAGSRVTFSTCEIPLVNEPYATALTGSDSPRLANEGKSYSNVALTCKSQLNF